MKRIFSVLLSVVLLFSLLPRLPLADAATPIIDDDVELPSTTLVGISADDVTIIEGSWQVPGAPGRYDVQAIVEDMELVRSVIPPGYTDITEAVDLEISYWDFISMYGALTLTVLDSQEEEPWGIGSHAVRLTYADLDLSADFHIVIAASPVAEIRAEDRYCIANWDDLAEPYEDGTERWEVDFDTPGYTLVLPDGTELTGYEAESLARQYHEYPVCSAAGDAAWVGEALTAGTRHSAICAMFGCTAEYTVISVASPVETMELPEKITPYYTDLKLNRDLLSKMTYTLRQDAEYVPQAEELEQDYYVSLYSKIFLPDGKLYDNAVMAHEDQTLTVNFLGAERTVDVEFLPSPVASLMLERSLLWQDVDEFGHDYQCRVCGFSLGGLPVSVTLTDGQVLRCPMNRLEYELREMTGGSGALSLHSDETGKWGLGEHSVTLSLYDVTYPLTVRVEPCPVLDFTLADAEVDQHAGGSWQPVLDEEGNEIPGQSWYRYDYPQITVCLTDGSTFTGSAEEVSERFDREIYITYYSTNEGFDRTSELEPGSYDVTVMFRYMYDECSLKIYPSLPFTDVSKTEYYAVPLYWAVNRGITSGTSADQFSPKKTCTREQVITFLYAAAGRPEHHMTESPFRDVKKGAYYYDAVLWAYENGIASGASKDLFGVKRPCTREQVVTFLWKAAGKPEHYSWGMPFSDVHPGKYYYEAVLWAHENGITSGVTETAFGVGKSCTRAQIVTFLHSARYWFSE